MECVNARLLLLFRRPGELAAEDAAALEHHLAACPTCSAAARRDSSFDTAVGQAMKSVPVPSSLRGKLLAESFARKGAILRRQAYFTVGIAACLLLSVGLVTGGIWAWRPPFDTYALATAYGREIDAPDHVTREWLAAEDLPPTLPIDFDFRFATFRGKMPHQGKDVPMIQFIVPAAGGPRMEARVLIVSESQFNLKNLKPEVDSFCSVDFRLHDGYAYIILFTTPTLDPFLKPPTRPA